MVKKQQKVATKTANHKRDNKEVKAKKSGSKLSPILISIPIIAFVVVMLVFALSNKNDVTIIKMSDEATALQQKMKDNPEKYGKTALMEGYFDAALAELYEREDQTFPNVSTENALDSTISFSAFDIITSEEEWNEIDTENLLDAATSIDKRVYTLEHENYENIVLYIHGGAYAYGIAEEHVTFADQLATELNAKVYLPIYSLAPQATYAEAYDMLTELYEVLLTQDKKIFIMGDSAGGGLAMAFTEYLKTIDEQLPDKVVLLSPWLDVSCSNPEIVEYETKDLTLAAYGPIQLGKMWAGDLDVKDPLVSPMYGEIEDLPDVMIFVGTDEIMYPDDTKFYEMLKDAGNDAKLVIGEGFWHVFPLSNIPERDYSLKLIKDFVFSS